MTVPVPTPTFSCQTTNERTPFGYRPGKHCKRRALSAPGSSLPAMAMSDAPTPSSQSHTTANGARLVACETALKPQARREARERKTRSGKKGTAELEWSDNMVPDLMTLTMRLTPSALADLQTLQR
ncbi:hypothetical protein GN958_ATG18548 [Phytophthora infestans]|uniref:Uncharacterized protein n=1 Tax=Phytophthora infestans TaxID=4787 RepID=A0A8S9TTV1_PHYIN|nr:hypothetical protein GN958_ATG18548 [Phytophthora infestans]